MLNESLPCPDLWPLSEKVTFTCVPASCARRASDVAPPHEAAAPPQLLPMHLCVDPDRSQLDRHKFSSSFSSSSASLSSSLVRAPLCSWVYFLLLISWSSHTDLFVDFGWSSLWTFSLQRIKMISNPREKKPTSTPEKSFFHLLTNIHLCGHK